MCGRTCLSLFPGDVVSACGYISTKYPAPGGAKGPEKKEPHQDDGKERLEEAACSLAVKKAKRVSIQAETAKIIDPEWREENNCGRKYKPSYNIAPSEITPVLVSTDHFPDDGKKAYPRQSRIVVPMMWGMIPFWHKGDYSIHGLTTNNCRLENMLDSKLYCGPFRQGQRCVVLCEGFYEWQTTKTAKPSERAPYFLHMPQSDGIVMHDKETWVPEEVKLLKIAGLFDVWQNKDGQKMYSYSVITFESTRVMSWLHHRMPAILETEQQVNDWLDFKRVSDETALAALRPAEALQFHRVSSLVNNSRYKSDKCNKPFEMVKDKTAEAGMSKRMLSWLKHPETETPKPAGENNTEEATSSLSTSESESENPSKRFRYRDSKAAKEGETTSKGSSSTKSRTPHSLKLIPRV